MVNRDIKGMRDVVQNSRLVQPNPEKVRATQLGSMDAFRELLESSWENPAAFWDQVARELHWFEPWTDTMSGDFTDFRFFYRWRQQSLLQLIGQACPSGSRK
jgi:acetyl-CoA synthetase